MIIDVKGTKSSKTEVDPAQKYELSEGNRLKQTPYVIGAMLMSVALYLKSIFGQAGAEAPPSEAPRAPAGEGKHPPSDGEIRAVLLEFPGASKFRDKGIPEYELTKAAIPKSSVLLNAEGAPITLDLEHNQLAAVAPMILSALAANANDHLAFIGEGRTRLSAKEGETDLFSAGSDNSAPGNDSDDDADDPGEGLSSNRAPQRNGPVVLYDASGYAILVIGLNELLSGTSDPDGDRLSVHTVTASHGVITKKAGHWEYQNDPEYRGVVTLHYEVTDGDLAVLQTAYINVQPTAIEGTAGDDQLVGTDQGDEIAGFAGDDNIYARKGDDTIYGGAGDDHIVAGDGHDIVFGGSGSDLIYGGFGHDQLFGGSGDDQLFGDDGDDILWGEEGNDRLFGGDGDDNLFGGSGDDVLDGGAGNDVLSDGMGKDILHGGEGDDVFIAAADGENDHFDGGEGFDTLDFSAATSTVVINLDEGVAYGEETGTDSFESIEAVTGGSGDDQFIASGGSFTLSGGGGNDVFEFRAPDFSENANATSNYTILDFKVGDKVVISKYVLFEKVLDKFEDEFEMIYGDDFDDDDIPIRYRPDLVDDQRRMAIEADFNNDGIWETSIFLEGSRALVVIEHA